MDPFVWKEKYLYMHAIAERIDKMRTERARRLCLEAGLDPGALGVHPHNAMAAFSSGHPWPGVNYSKVRACLRMLKLCFEGYDIVRRWDARVRNYTTW